jgi:Tfp pilus assembly protein PilF
LPERKRVDRATSGRGSALQRELRKLLLAWPLLHRDRSMASRAVRFRNTKGQFRRAYEEYQRLAEKHPEDARLHYNAGAPLIRRSVTTRPEALVSAINPKDLPLQQSAYYNLGNTHFESVRAEDPPKASRNWL